MEQLKETDVNLQLESREGREGRKSRGKKKKSNLTDPTAANPPPDYSPPSPSAPSPYPFDNMCILNEAIKKYRQLSLEAQKEGFIVKTANEKLAKYKKRFEKEKQKLEEYIRKESHKIGKALGEVENAKSDVIKVNDTLEKAKFDTYIASSKEAFCKVEVDYYTFLLSVVVPSEMKLDISQWRVKFETTQYGIYFSVFFQNHTSFMINFGTHDDTHVDVYVFYRHKILRPFPTKISYGPPIQDLRSFVALGDNFNPLVDGAKLLDVIKQFSPEIFSALETIISTGGARVGPLFEKQLDQ